MARIVVTAPARGDLRDLMHTHSLPRDTEARFARSIEALARFLLAVVDARSGRSPTARR